ncbi:MAG: hypothetical protein DI598_03225 [Pseudopedobacter saltans]|uniref:MORN repeat variant n=1 Tax=Pseudopedobacter saltans TaxID=151895 RepID=A0A2W5F970_9SPHI|nr:MAG: hypothetical protein DI598_03225 [Pseudopedobacter saltans]
MKYGLIVFFFIAALNTIAQNKTDANGLKQGYWHINMPEKYGEPAYQDKGYYKDGKKEGIWLHLSDMGDTLAIERYKYGNKNGISKYYNLEGIVRVESWIARNPDNPYDTIDVYDINDPNKIEKKVVKIEGSSVKHGKWIYYYPGGRMVEREEKYVLGQLQNDAPLQNKTVKATTDTSSKKIKIIPKEVLKYEKENSGKKKIKVRTGSTGL